MKPMENLNIELLYTDADFLAHLSYQQNFCYSSGDEYIKFTQY